MQHIEGDLIDLGKHFIETLKQSLSMSEDGVVLPVAIYFAPSGLSKHAIHHFVCDDPTIEKCLRLVYRKEIVDMQHRLSAKVMAITFTRLQSSECTYKRELWLHLITHQGMNVVMHQPFEYRHSQLLFNDLIVDGPLPNERGH